jgi:hypothetical protein
MEKRAAAGAGGTPKETPSKWIKNFALYGE